MENSGPEIAPHERDRVFDGFYRLDGARIGVTNASGPGLSIARNIIILHQERWSARSSDRHTRCRLFSPQRKPAEDVRQINEGIGMPGNAG